MSVWVAVLPLVGFFLALVAYWCWTRAREAATDADLQRRMWEHSKYQRDTFRTQTPLDVSNHFRAEQRKFRLLSLGVSVAAVLCFVVALLQFSALR